MRVANRAGRLVWLGEGTALDVERATGGRFGPDPMDAFTDWEALRALAEGVSPDDGEPCAPAELGPCVPRPGAVYAIGLNYRDHAAEAGLPEPGSPMVFTKFPACLAGPEAPVRLSSDRVDWEAELVVVIGRPCTAVSEADGFAAVAGYCVGQDVSDRRMQFKDKPAQFSLGKSLPGFGPIGPAVTSLDRLADPLDLAITCDLDGERVQESRTREMIFPVPALVAFLSRHIPLAPGDLVFTGTPAGVGSVRTPRRYLQAGEQLTTRIEGLGALHNRCVAAAG